MCLMVKDVSIIKILIASYLHLCFAFVETYIYELCGDQVLLAHNGIQKLKINLYLHEGAGVKRFWS